MLIICSSYSAMSDGSEPLSGECSPGARQRLRRDREEDGRIIKENGQIYQYIKTQYILSFKLLRSCSAYCPGEFILCKNSATFQKRKI